MIEFKVSRMRLQSFQTTRRQGLALISGDISALYVFCFFVFPFDTGKMPFTKEFNFPSDEELNVEEVNLSLSALKAGATYLGKYCEQQNNEFMLCRKENYDPRKCLEEGRIVTQCTLEFFRKVKKHCCNEFNQYANCLFKSSNTMSLAPCRNTEAALDKCILDNLEIEKPPFGYFAEVQIHKTDRPKPPPTIDYYPDAADKFPYGEFEINEPRYGTRPFSKS